MDKTIRIVIADDQPLFRVGMRRALSDHVYFEVVSECANADEAVEAVCEHRPDIILLGRCITGGGIEAARRILETCPFVRIIFVTASERESDVMEALKLGACGYVLKVVEGEEMESIIKIVIEGEIYVSPTLAARQLIDIKDQKDCEADDLFADLTVCEEQILKLISQGQSNKEVARVVKLRKKTVEHYVTTILQKLQVRDRLEAAIKAHNHYTDIQTVIGLDRKPNGTSRKVNITEPVEVDFD